MRETSGVEGSRVVEYRSGLIDTGESAKGEENRDGGLAVAARDVIWPLTNERRLPLAASALVSFSWASAPVRVSNRYVYPMSLCGRSSVFRCCFTVAYGALICFLALFLSRF